ASRRLRRLGLGRVPLSARAAAPFSPPPDGPAFLSGMRCLAILSIVSQPLLCRRVIVSAAINLVPERTGYKSRAYDSRGAAGLQCLNPGRPAQIPGQQARPVHARGTFVSAGDCVMVATSGEMQAGSRRR